MKGAMTERQIFGGREEDISALIETIKQTQTIDPSNEWFIKEDFHEPFFLDLLQYVLTSAPEEVLQQLSKLGADPLFQRYLDAKSTLEEDKKLEKEYSGSLLEFAIYLCKCYFDPDRSQQQSA